MNLYIYESTSSRQIMLRGRETLAVN